MKAKLPTPKVGKTGRLGITSVAGPIDQRRKRKRKMAKRGKEK